MRKPCTKKRRPVEVEVVEKKPVPRCDFKPKNEKQAEAVKKIRENDIIFLTGPAGTGKTIIAVAQGCIGIVTNRFEKVILTRPIVEAGESLGFLPGAIDEKAAPYMAPMFANLKKFVPEGILERAVISKQIEIVPLAYMRGRSIEHSFVICDEAQNASDEQIKMLLTRIGEGSKMVICSDPEQTDLRTKNRIEEISRELSNISGIDEVIFGESDIVRHRLITDILKVFKEIQYGTEHRIR